MRTSQRLLIFAALLALAALSAPVAFAHCQVPCGIYGDETRFVTLREHVTTIEKSMQQIVELGGQSPANYNQIVRWVDNKEVHADALTEIVTYYFLAQRIKAPTDGAEASTQKYLHELALLHSMMVHSMKAKQTTDLAHVKALRESIDAFEKSYMGEKAGHSH